MRSHILRIGISLLAAVVLTTTAVGQTPTFQPLMTGQTVSALQYAGDHVYAGMPKGGVLEWDPATGEAVRLLTRAEGLGGHFVTAMAWTGAQLWVATADGGLTAITDPGGSGESMQAYSSLLSSLDITAVDGMVVGETERVFYGTDGDGIGAIVAGLPSAYYDTQNGLIDDTVDHLAMNEDILLVATPIGISRFADNAFINYPYDDPDTDAVNDLVRGPDGRIWAATATGVRAWDDAARDWVHVFSSETTRALAVDGAAAWSLTWHGTERWEGGATTEWPLPQAAPGDELSMGDIAAGSGEAWLGGLIRPENATDYGLLASAPWVATAAPPPVAIRSLETLQVGVAGGCDGVAVDSRGRPWLGDREGDGLGSFDGSVWYNAVERATVDNDSMGFFDYSGGLLAMARDGDALWFSQFTRGVVRFVPAEQPGGVEDWLLLSPENSPIQGDGFINIGAHPDGVVFFGTDNSNFGGTDNTALGVDVLVDQSRPRDPASWLHLYPSVLGGNVIGAIGVEARDVIWFAVRNVGLRRWDVNGLGAGPDDPLTWLDTSDDHWADPIEYLPGSSLPLDAANAIVVAPDGSIFVGGSGLVQFSYQPILGLVTPIDEWERKASAVDDGLLGQSVSGLAFDRNDHLWVLSDGGLDRLRFLDARVAIDPFTDLASYLQFDSSFYPFSAIAPLPGGTYRRLAASDDGRTLALSSDLGGCSLMVPEASTEVADDDLAAAYLFPNPFPGDDRAAYLGLGGLDVDDEMPVSVEILNLAGQMVHRSQDLDTGDRIWDGLNRQGRQVASGLYIVKLSYGGKTTMRTLAVAF